MDRLDLHQIARDHARNSCRNRRDISLCTPSQSGSQRLVRPFHPIRLLSSPDGFQSPRILL